MIDKKNMEYKNEWNVLIAGSLIGLLASFIQIIERIKFAENPTANLVCNINNSLSCSNVFSGWQSSVFGFSNSILCLTFFSLMLGIALSGRFSKEISKKLRLTMHFLSVFFLLFGAWYLQQSVFSIGAICLFCIFCYSGVIAINWSWLRINMGNIYFISKNTQRSFERAKNRGLDTFLWILWGLIIASMFLFIIL